MKVLYIDCFGGFTSSMLLGALIDMGASANFACVELKHMGIEADIISDRINRCGMEAVFAYAKCLCRESDICTRYEALIQAMCEELGEDFTQSENVCTWAAVLCCMDFFGADKIICSPLTDGSGIDASTGEPIPSARVADIARKYKMPIRSIDVQSTLVSSEGAVFLGEAVDEFGVLPLGNILCIGYGAGEVKDSTCPNIVRCVLTETDDGSVFAQDMQMLFV